MDHELALAAYNEALDAQLGLGIGSTAALGELADYHALSEVRQKALEDCHAAAVKKANQDLEADFAPTPEYRTDRDPFRTRSLHLP